MHQRPHFVGAILRAALAAAALCCIACGSSTPSPTAPCTAHSCPGTPVTENREPSVSVKFTGASSCKPHGSFLCALEVTATASDPDGDALMYAWSGCATGTAATAVCTIKDPGTVAATVAVDDGHGHTVSASAPGEGDSEPNRPPSVRVVFPAGTQCVLSAGSPCTLDVAAQASDPDGDTLRYSWSGCAGGSSDRAQCTVSAPGPATATVTVDDLHTHVVHASATASGSGTNRLPDVSVGYVVISCGSG